MATIDGDNLPYADGDFYFFEQMLDPPGRTVRGKVLALG